MDQVGRNPISRRIFVGGTAAVIGAFGVSTIEAASASAAPSTATPPGGATTLPSTIPAVQDWRKGRGSFRLGPSSRVIVHRRDAGPLNQVAQLFAADLAAVAKNVSRQSSSDRAARKGDIVLQLGSVDRKLGSEGYVLEIGEQITVTARTAAGVLYGTQTLLQMLRQTKVLPAGTVKDWPGYEERGFLVDIGRMYFSLEWLKARVRDMAYLKLNTLFLHLTDDEGWRVESKLGVQSAQFLTKREVRELVAYATRFNVTVIPEIDMPAHLGALLTKYPQFRLVDPAGTVSPTKIDFTIPGAIDLLKSVLAEYVPLFPGRHWHLGQDEYLANSHFADYPQLQTWAQGRIGAAATAKDAIILFANEMNAFIRNKGKIGRIWNDNVGPGTTVEVDKNLIIQWWTDADAENFFGDTGPYAPQVLLDMGYQVMNNCFLPTYAYPPGGQTPPIRADYLYDSWSVDRFYGYLYSVNADGSYQTYLPIKTVAVGAPGLRGASLNNWNSGGTWTEAEAAADLSPRLRSVTQKAWNSPQEAADYTAFQSVIAAVGSAPA